MPDDKLPSINDWDDSKELPSVDDFLKEEVEEELDFDNFLQELEHELLPVEEKLPRDFTSDEEKAVVHYRQACELNPALTAGWNFLYQYFVDLLSHELTLINS